MSSFNQSDDQRGWEEFAIKESQEREAFQTKELRKVAQTILIDSNLSDEYIA